VPLEYTLLIKDLNTIFYTFFPHLRYVIGVLLWQYLFITVYVDSLTARLPVDSTL